MKKAIAAFAIGFVVSVSTLVVLKTQTSWNGRLMDHKQDHKQMSKTAGGNDFTCGDAELVLSDQVCNKSSATAEIKNIPENCNKADMKVKWSTEDGGKLVKGEGDNQREVTEDTKLALKEYKQVGVVPDGDGGKEDVKVEAEITGTGENCEDCGKAEDTTDVGCTLDITADSESVKVSNTATLTVKYKSCGSSSGTESCTVDVSASGQAKGGGELAPNSGYHVDEESLTFWGKKDKEKIKVTGYREGTVTVSVGGGSSDAEKACDCGQESKTISIKSDNSSGSGGGSGSSGSEIKIDLHTKSQEEKKVEDGRIEYLCNMKPGKYELNRYCWGDNNKQNADVNVSVEGGVEKDKLIGGPDKYTLSCGGTRTKTLNVNNLQKWHRPNRGAYPRFKAESSCCGEDTTDKYNPEICHVDLSGGENLKVDSPVCPEDEALTFSAETTCKADDCADGIDWTYPGGLEKTGGGDGSKTISLENNSDQPVGGSITAAANQKDVSGGIETDCQYCKSDSVYLGSAITRGTYQTLHDGDNPEENKIGASGYGLQTGYLSFDLSNVSGQGFLAGVNDSRIKSIEITNAYVRVTGAGNRFPWIDHEFDLSDRPTIHQVIIAGKRFTIDEQPNDGEPVTEANNILNGSVPVEDVSNESLRVKVQSPRDNVYVYATISLEVNYIDRCGAPQSFDFGQNFSGTVKYKGLNITRIPEIVFAESEYWVPLKVELPEYVTETYEQSAVEEVRVSLRDKREFETETIEEIRTYTPDPSDGICWGFGDGTTSKGTFYEVDDESEPVLGGRKTITVFVKLDKLLMNRSFLKETEDSKPIHMIKKSGPFRMPHFNVHVSLNENFTIQRPSQFASLDPDDGRPELLADHRVGPVIDGEMSPQDVDWISQEAKKNNYLAPIVFQEAKLIHDDGEEKYSVSDSTRDGTDLLHRFAFKAQMPDESDMKAEYDEASAEVHDEETVASDGLTDVRSIELATNLAEVSTGAHSGEKGVAIATLSNGALFYLSYGKNEKVDICKAMDLSEDNFNIAINKAPFKEGKLALGRKSLESSLALDVGVTVTAFVTGTAITYLTAGVNWVYAGTALASGSTVYGILSALDNENNPANVTRVDFISRKLKPSQFAKWITEDEKERVDELGSVLTWDEHAHPPASDETKAGGIDWKQTGETYEFSDVNLSENGFYTDSGFYPNDISVGSRIDFVFHARMESSMQNEWLDDIQVISKIWYQHPDHKPLREIKLVPAKEDE